MKTNLIKALNTAITALEADTITYSWCAQQSCNCGVVAQAITGKTSEQIYTLFDRAAKNVSATDNGGKTWKNVVKNTCDITGKTSSQILNELFAAGLSAQDICHLEFLENPAILQRSGVYYDGVKTTKVKTGTKTVITKTGWFSKKTEVIDVFEEQTKEYKNYLEPKYYTKKENLIKYLKAWSAILQEEAKQVEPTFTKEQLGEELLKAVADEKYELAAELRDKMAVK